MGIQRNEGSGNGAVFLRINAKEGCIQHAQKGPDGKSVKGEDGKNIVIKEPAMTQIVGTLVGMSFEEDEYQGAKTYQVRLALQDPEPGQPKMFVDFPFGSEANGAGFFGLALMGKLNAADLTKPIALMPWHMAEGSKIGDGAPLAKAMTGVTLYQGGQKIKEDFGGGADRLPTRPKVMVGSKEVTDNSAWDALAQQMFAGLKSKVTPGAGEAHGPADDGVDPSEMNAALEQAQAAAPAAARPRFGA